MTRESKAKLTQVERQACRSPIGAFRRDPARWTAAAPPAWEALVEPIPPWKPLYRVRLRFREICDTARARITAAWGWRPLRRETDGRGRDLSPFLATSDRWTTEIVNALDASQTSAAVEGITHQARGITPRTEGLKSADSLWRRLILDLHRASAVIGGSIEQIRQMAHGQTALFDPSCT